MWLTSCAPSDTGESTEVQPVLTASHADAEQWATETLANMTLRQKVGQMIVEQLHGDYDKGTLEHWQTLVRDHGIGGFVVYGGTPHATANLLNQLQTLAEVPLMISIYLTRMVRT